MGVSWVLELFDTSTVTIETKLIVAGAELVGGYTVDSTPYKPSEQVVTIKNKNKLQFIG